MRVTTDFWVSALMRRAFATGGFATVVKRGAGEAGAVFLLVRDRFGETRLYTPASQASYDEARPHERFFTPVAEILDEDRIADRIEREKRFDPDLWVVELEIDEAVFTKLVSIRA